MDDYELYKDENGRKSNCAIAKLVYIHEGFEKDALKAKAENAGFRAAPNTSVPIGKRHS